MPKEITVRVLKYDGTEHRKWNARIARREESLIILDAEFEIDVSHDLLGSIPGGTRTVEYYWLDRWYNVFQFLADDGTTRIYYCNINMPPQLNDDALTYIDLDIDVLVQPDLSFQVLDLEEFEANALRYGYSEEVKRETQAAINELAFMIELRQFPFAENALNSSVSSGIN
jgi:uncharacterized protein